MNQLGAQSEPASGSLVNQLGVHLNPIRVHSFRDNGLCGWGKSVTLSV